MALFALDELRAVAALLESPYEHQIFVAKDYSKAQLRADLLRIADAIDREHELVLDSHAECREAY